VIVARWAVIGRSFVRHPEADRLTKRNGYALATFSISFGMGIRENA
jgi:hypothetical protein